MGDLGFERMQAMQRALQAKNSGIWETISPKIGRDMLLWMIVEAGEAADIIKKSGDEAIMGDPDTRRRFVEELCDVMMYLNDVMLCYGITPDEVEKVYTEKFERNMTRWQ